MKKLCYNSIILTRISWREKDYELSKEKPSEEYTRMTRDMTKGPVFSTLILFTIPLILGNLLQLTYNAIDSMIVGRYVGRDALAAVGTGNPLMTLILLFMNGICLGSGILVSYYYGAGKESALKRLVSTGMVTGILFALASSILLCLFASPVLRLLQVPEEILALSASYLRIILAGLVFSFLYNYLASILRAMGDSRTPLCFLAISAVLNIAGDLFFVIILDMGIHGAALSTVLCEAVSAILCWLYTVRKIEILRLGREWLTADAGLLKQILSYGIVSALQQSAVQAGKLMVQAMVNTLGVTTTAAFNITNRFDDYAIIPEQNMAHAMTSVMAQNVGAGEKERVSRTFRYGFYLEMTFGVVIGIMLYLFATPLMRLFTRDAEVIREGERYLHLMAFMYPLPAFTNWIQGYFRGIGDLKVTLISSLINIGGRVIACFILIYHFHMGFLALPWGYLTGWAAMILFEVPFWFYYRKHHGMDRFGK